MECLEKDNITVGYTTVYRALERLEEEGKVIKLPTEDGTKTRYCFAEKEILENLENWCALSVGVLSRWNVPDWKLF